MERVNILLIASSIILIMGSIYMFVRDKYIDYNRINNITKGIFLVFFLLVLIGIIIGNYPIIGQETFFLVSIGLYTLMSGNINKKSNT